VSVLAAPAPEEIRRALLLRLVGASVAAALAAMTAAAPDLTLAAKVALVSLIGASAAWTLTRIEPALIAIAAAAAMTLGGAATTASFTFALSADILWLLLGVFVLAAAFETSGLGARLRGSILSGAQTPGGMFVRLGVFMTALSFVAPSTSARAAMASPALSALFKDGRQERVRRAFALFIPIVLLLTTNASLIGAGSHLLANDFLHQQTGARLSYVQWAVWGLPFALLMAGACYLVVSRLYLTEVERKAALTAPQTAPKQALRPEEWRVLAMLAALLAFWTGGPWHGLNIGVGALFMALLATLPRIGVLSARQAFQSTPWRILAFAFATLIMGAALVESGAADWAVAHVWAAIGAPTTPFAAYAAIAAVTMGSHLLIVSHVARAAVLMPTVLALAERLHLDPAAAVFLAAVGANYCITLPISSKALVIFAGDGVEPADLARISAILAPVYFLAMLGFALIWWR